MNSSAALPWWTAARALEGVRQRGIWNALRIAPWKVRARRILSLGFRILWPIGSAVVCTFAATAIKSTPQLGEASAQYLLGMVSLFTALILLVSAIKFAYQTFFAAPDLPLLQALPISPRGIFVAKYLDNLAFSNYLITIFAAGPWIGFGLAFGWPLPKLLLALAGLWFLPVYTTAIGILVSLFISRFVTRSRMREVLMLGSMAVSIFFYSAMRVAIRDEISSGSIDPRAFLWPLMPTSWLALWALDLDPGNSQTWLLQYFFLGATLFVISAWFGDTVYHWGVTHLQTDSQVAHGSGTPLLLRFPGAPNPARAYWFKDLTTFTRDPRQWYYLLFFAILFFIPLDPTGQADEVSGFEGFLIQAVGNTFVVVIMATMALQELTVYGLSREGNRRWILHASPIEPLQLLHGKFSAVFLATVLLTLTGVLALVLVGHLEWSEAPTTVIGTLIIAGCINWAFLSLGCRWPDFEGYHQRQRVNPILALAIAAVDSLVMGVFLFSAFLLSSYQHLRTALPLLEEVPYSAVLTAVTITMAAVLLALIAGGLWNGYTALQHHLQEHPEA